MQCSGHRSSLFLGASCLVLAAYVAPVLAQQAAPDVVDTIIVTGTRISGMKAEDSPAPVLILGDKALTSVGEPNLISSLSTLVPSFEAEAHGGDTGTLAMSARLRGLSPNDTLVLVDGKRRHATANLHVLGGAFQGAATTDLDLIPPDAIDHIEVLEDGAAAQYGSDAIAGVVNIMLKHNNSGGMLSGTVGQYFQGDGETYDISGNTGYDLGGKGFLSISAERRFRDYSYRNGPDPRVATASGAPIAGLPFDATKIPGFPNAGTNIGDPQSALTTVFYNSEYEVSDDVKLYSFGSYGHRFATANETYRSPSQAGFLAQPYSNQQYLPAGSSNPGCGTGITPANGVNPCYEKIPSGSYSTPGEVIFSPIGFRAQETLLEDDYSFTFGARGAIVGWTWDLSGTYGKDTDLIGTINSGNGSIFVDTHSTPTRFYDGSFIASELTGDLDISKGLDVGLVKPISIAFGLEGRKNTYAITQGDPDSYFGIGAASFPGFGPTSAVDKSRRNYAEYVDIALSPIQDLQTDIAGRHEYYTDFGSATVGKFTARYDFTPAFAVRGTVSSGFRAPTLPEEYYTQINVTPISATVNLGANSAAAAAEGLPKLKPETSVNYSLGFVFHPWDRFSATLDGYIIALHNRIVGTGTAPCMSNGVTISPLVCNAITANGNVLDPSVVSTGTTEFANGLDTLSHGIDATVNYYSDFGQWGRVDWTGAANWNKIAITRIAPNPPALAGVLLQTPGSLANITTLDPQFKFVLGGLWTLGDWSLSLREEIFGPTTGYVSPGTGVTAPYPVASVVNGANYYALKTPTAGITDISLAYAFTRNISITLGADNLLNQSPPRTPVTDRGGTLDGGSVLHAPLTGSPYGINGGFYYGRINFNW
jgi:iron complex outermembrane recepter protein